MNREQIVAAIDAEIAILQAARRALTGTSPTTSRTGAGRMARKHRMTAAGRRRLSEMMKKRWAERRRKAAAKAK